MTVTLVVHPASTPPDSMREVLIWRSDTTPLVGWYDARLEYAPWRDRCNKPIDVLYWADWPMIGKETDGPESV